MLERETSNEERAVLFGLRALSQADLDAMDAAMERIFWNNLIDGPRSQPHFRTREFCRMYAQCLLDNKRLELTPLGLKFVDENLAVLDTNYLLHSILELKKTADLGSSFYFIAHGILNDYQQNLYLLKRVGTRCDACGSNHQSGDVTHFNRYVLTRDRKFRCYCPACLGKLLPDFDPGLRMTDANRIVLTGLDIFDSDEELGQYLVNVTPMEYRSLANPYAYYYSHTFTIWELCHLLGEASSSDKKIEVESGCIDGVADGVYTRLCLR